MFTQMEYQGASDLHLFHDAATGLQAIIAIHSTALGAAIGGCRFIEYTTHDDAIQDALRLAKGMSYKAALAGLPHGGGKSVIIKPRKPFDRRALMLAFGECIDQLQGRYITAMDSGTLTTDMDAIAEKTRWVSCTSSAGDPSTYTSLGVIEGIKSAVKHLFDKDNLEGIRIAIQGLGHVGMAVASHLSMEGAHLTVTDINTSLMKTAVEEYKAKAVAPDDIYATDVDIFCPCGLGGVLNKNTIGQIKAQIIAGSANNQLLTSEDGYALDRRQILYVPDYVINSGGLIFVALAHAKEDPQTIHHQVANIGKTLTQLFSASQTSSIPPFALANQQAESIISAAAFHSRDDRRIIS
ncbi:Leu/Phe/Val dehydrogenase [Neptunomonas qingdaonensis]|uniref:Leucine dehydrogenase n=1 Tax=Neptunomonas qingdaonensis TaxID=1045558 RepID=A0A1I2S5N0_9GAMM|nr:amino acid dehydrogenase [Neptunomonas qingdaonensis]SFG46147.1 leucine dehydrogenase [Neptunomonas qingdaonensis]